VKKKKKKRKPPSEAKKTGGKKMQRKHSQVVGKVWRTARNKVGDPKRGSQGGSKRAKRNCGTESQPPDFLLKEDGVRLGKKAGKEAKGIGKNKREGG